MEIFGVVDFERRETPMPELKNGEDDFGALREKLLLLLLVRAAEEKGGRRGKGERGAEDATTPAKDDIFSLRIRRCGCEILSTDDKMAAVYY